MKVKGVEVPDPGSTDAVAEGCVCPQMDNLYGQGVPGYPTGTFWINEGCPLHSEAFPFDPDGIGGNELLIVP